MYLIGGRKGKGERVGFIAEMENVDGVILLSGRLVLAGEEYYRKEE